MNVGAQILKQENLICFQEAPPTSPSQVFYLQLNWKKNRPFFPTELFSALFVAVNHEHMENGDNNVAASHAIKLATGLQRSLRSSNKKNTVLELTEAEKNQDKFV